MSPLFETPPEAAPAVEVAAPRALRLIRALGPHGIEIGMCSLLINACGLVMPIFSMLVYDKVVGNGNNETLWALAAGMLLVLLLEFVARLIREYAVERLGAVADLKTETQLFDRLLEANPQEAASPGVLMSRYRDHAGARDTLFAQYAVVAADMPFLALFLVALGFLGGPLVLIPVCFTIPLLAGQWLAMKPQRDYAERNQATAARKTSTLSELVGGLAFFQTAESRNLITDRWDDDVRACALLRSRQRFWQTAAQAWGGLCIGLASVVLLAAGVYRIEMGAMSVGALIACSLVQLRAMIQVSSMVSLAFSWQDLTRTQSELDAAVRVDNAPPMAEAPMAAAQMQEISVQRLSCRLDGAEALSELSLVVDRGERVAIVGRPGAGKSTLLRCIAGAQRPSSGQVLVEGTRVNAMAPEARWPWMVYKPQEPVIVGPTLHEDLPVPDGGRGSAALELTGFSAAFRQGRMRRDQEVVAGGRNLSGGQRQLVALARALATDASIYLLDEPTAGVDADTEAQLVEAVDRLTRGKTVVAATHCAALIHKFDRIVVLDQGRVIASGPPSKLLAAKSDST